MKDGITGLSAAFNTVYAAYDKWRPTCDKALYQDVSYKLYHRTRVFDAKGYVALLGTYSNHLALEDEVRISFFKNVQQVIEQHGDRITIHDAMDLQLSRKP